MDITILMKQIMHKHFINFPLHTRERYWHRFWYWHMVGTFLPLSVCPSDVQSSLINGCFLLLHFSSVFISQAGIMYGRKAKLVLCMDAKQQKTQTKLYPQIINNMNSCLMIGLVGILLAPWATTVGKCRKNLLWSLQQNFHLICFSWEY